MGNTRVEERRVFPNRYNRAVEVELPSTGGANVDGTESSKLLQIGNYYFHPSSEPETACHLYAENFSAHTVLYFS
jgi:hypothetical protein